MSKKILYHFVRQKDLEAVITNNYFNKSPLVEVLKKIKIKFDQVNLILVINKKYFSNIYANILKLAVEKEYAEIYNNLNKNFIKFIDGYRDITENHFRREIKSDIIFENLLLNDEDSYSHKFYSSIIKIAEKNSVFVIHDSIYELGTDFTILDEKEFKNLHFVVNKTWLEKDSKKQNDFVEGLTENIDLKLNSTLKERKKSNVRLEKLNNFEDIYTVNLEMLDIIKYARYISSFKEDVLILGDTGTGKELFAQAIHQESKRNKKPFVAVNCAALPESLFESELFGIEKGVASYVFERTGLMESANNGTLFLDEIGDLSLNNQTKLLRALQERKIRRVGGKEDININVRLICATNRFSQKNMNDFFRNDLFYRINEMQIILPSLKERGKNDIYLLLSAFIEEEKNKHPEYKDIKLTSQVLEFLIKYSWPGNIRELKLFVKRALSVSAFMKKDINNYVRSICLDYLDSENRNTKEKGKEVLENKILFNEPFSYLYGININEGLNLENTLKSIEKYYISKAYDLTKNETRAGLLLGYKQGKMSRKILEYELKKNKNRI